MKKLILSLLIFCSAFVSAQISIPQVTGLPAALNSKVDKATGKSLIADTLVAKIQPHVTNLSNPHSVTKSQVGLGNVDNTSDANKPISTATQSALNGKQASGTYSTDIHGNITALNAVLGINTGDETLTSIKTKLGAATAVSDGYLKYQDFALLHTPTTVTAANGLSISGQNISLQNASLSQSGALTFNDYNKFNSKEPAITKNTAFNKNFGTTTGTVLEGRTFGTAANSSVGDFVQIQSSSVQHGSAWLNGTFTSEGGFRTKGRVANPNNGAILFNDGTGENLILAETAPSVYSFGSGAFGTLSTPTLSLNTNTKTATFASTVNSTGFLLNGNNLTSSLSTNYLSKWNGSSMVNSLISESGTTATINGTVNATQFISPNGTYHRHIYTDSSGKLVFSNEINSAPHLDMNTNGEVRIYTTAVSTSPTTGALVVNGGIGVGGQIVANGNIFGNSQIYTNLFVSSGSEGLRINNSSAYLSGFNTAGTLRQGYLQFNSNDIIVQSESGSRTFLINPAGGNTSIGYTSDQGYKLAVNGTGYFNGNVTATGEITAYSTSDIRLKENIKPLNKSLAIINKLNPVSYNWNDKAKELNKNKNDKTDVGVIAQELKEVLPNLVHGIYNDEFLSVDYVKLIPYLIGAIQELTDKINKLENNK